MRDGTGVATQTLIDGRPSAADWLQERGFQFGDGLFETLAVVDGVPCLWQSHIQRLLLGCQRLRLPPPDLSRLQAEAEALCAGQPSAVLKIFWTAGLSPRGYRRPAVPRQRRILQRSAWPEVAVARPWRLRLCSHRLGDNPGLAGIKHLNRLDQVLARAEWDDAAIDEGLMLDQAGQVVAGTMSNLFVQAGGVLITPPVERAGIDGVVRRLVLACAAQAGAPFSVEALSVEQLRCADAVYLANSLIGVVRVGRFEDLVYDPALPVHPALSEAARLCHSPSGWGVADA